MSFSSKSSNKKHYRNGHYGSNHYQRKGILNKLFDIITSRSWSGSNYNNYRNQYNNTYRYNQHTSNESTIICNNCNAEIPVGSKFCLQCGESVSQVLFCQNCGEKLPPNAKFCLKRGNKISK